MKRITLQSKYALTGLEYQLALLDVAIPVGDSVKLLCLKGWIAENSTLRTPGWGETKGINGVQGSSRTA